MVVPLATLPWLMIPVPEGLIVWRITGRRRITVLWVAITDVGMGALESPGRAT
jgi:hypothetical protein